MSTVIRFAVICDPICENNGTCEYPGICVCDPGWTGGSCDKGECQYIAVPQYLCNYACMTVAVTVRV